MRLEYFTIYSDFPVICIGLLRGVKKLPASVDLLNSFKESFFNINHSSIKLYL